MLATVWTLSLLLFKFYFGVERVGWAAGGQVVDVKQLKHEHRLEKNDRKQRIVRNWRVQTACLVACASLLPVSMLMLRLGLNPVIASLEELREINDQVDSRAFRGMLIVAELQTTQKDLHTMRQSGLLAEEITDEQFCPSFANTTGLLDDETVPSRNASISDIGALQSFLPSSLQRSVASGLDNMQSILLSYELDFVGEALSILTNATATIDSGIDNMYSHDWIVKLLVVIMNVVVIFLMVGILIAKENTDYPAYQSFAAWVLLPLFGVIQIAAVGGTCIFLSVSMLNAGTFVCLDGLEYPLIDRFDF